MGISIGRQAVEEEPTPNHLCEKPWRKFEAGGQWTKDYRDTLVKSIKTQKTRGGLKSGNIILIGLVKAGKSSFLNSVAAIDEGRISMYSNAGEMEHSMTLRLVLYVAEKYLENFRLYDVMGLDINGGIELEDIKQSIEGHILPNYQYKLKETIATGSDRYNTDPQLADKIHCVAIVVDAETIIQGSSTPGMDDSLKRVQKIVQGIDAPTVLILTKIDKICDAVKNDVTTTFSSRKVEESVEKASSMFGVPVMCIFPVQNYTREMDLDFRLDILILMALRFCINAADDYLKKQANHQLDDTEQGE